MRMLKEPEAAGSLSHPRGSSEASCRVAGASGRHGGVHAGNRTRRANVTGLLWTQVDLERRRSLDSSRSGQGAEGDCGAAECGGGALIRKQIGKHPTHVFSFQGKPITQVSTKAWYQALKRAGIEDFRWHDLRHTWASWHVQQGTPLTVLQELGGWESAEMVRRYAHFSPDHLSPYADRLRGVGSVNKNADGTNTAQP